MGIERARVVEVWSPASPRGGVGSGYLVGDRLVLTAGCVVSRRGSTDVRLAGTGTWVPASLAWSTKAGNAAVLEVDDPAALGMAAVAPRWGQVAGGQPIGVTAVGFPASSEKPAWARDVVQFVGRLSPGNGRMPVAFSRPPDQGMTGAALFAGAELVGVLLAGPEARAVAVSVLADDLAFVDLVGDAGGIDLAPVSAPASGFPILHAP